MCDRYFTEKRNVFDGFVLLVTVSKTSSKTSNADTLAVTLPKIRGHTEGHRPNTSGHTRFLRSHHTRNFLRSHQTSLRSHSEKLAVTGQKLPVTRPKLPVTLSKSAAHLSQIASLFILVPFPSCLVTVRLWASCVKLRLRPSLSLRRQEVESSSTKRTDQSERRAFVVSVNGSCKEFRSLVTWMMGAMAFHERAPMAKLIGVVVRFTSLRRQRRLTFLRQQASLYCAAATNSHIITTMSTYSSVLNKTPTPFVFLKSFRPETLAGNRRYHFIDTCVRLISPVQPPLTLSTVVVQRTIWCPGKGLDASMD